MLLRHFSTSKHLAALKTEGTNWPHTHSDGLPHRIADQTSNNQNQPRLHRQISIMPPSTLQPPVFHIITASFLPHSPHFLRTYSTILCWPICKVQWDRLCVVHQLVFSRYHCPGYLILQWEWSSAPICSHLLLLHFNYTVLIGFASMLWSQRVLPGKQSTVTEYSDPDILIELILTRESVWVTLRTLSYPSLINRDNARNASLSPSVLRYCMCLQR